MPTRPYSLYAPDPSLPGFPLTIEPQPNCSPDAIALLMRVFHNACEAGNMPLANDTFVTLRAAISEYALYHFEAVAAHMQATMLTLAMATPSAPPATPTAPGGDNATPTS